MKSLLFAILVSVVGPLGLQSQQISVGISTAAYGNWLSTISGELERARAGCGESYAADVDAAVHFPSGFAIGITAGIQTERVYFNEIMLHTGTPMYTKHFRNPVGGVYGSYSIPIGLSRFNAVVSMGLGVGSIQADNMSRYWAKDDIYSWHEPQTQNSGTDTMHIVFDLRDNSSANTVVQGRAAFGVEYRKNHFYAKLQVESRIGLNDIAEIEYHIERMDTYYLYEHNYVADGHFTARGGYVGVGLSAGWYFGTTAEQ